MSAHFDKFGLNTYYGTPYFQAHVSPEYPLSRVLQKSRAFRRLPPRLRQLAALAKRWLLRQRQGQDFYDIQSWYDSAGNELNPNTGRKLTDKEIDDEWDTFHPDPTLSSFTVEDIPIPPGGFADPDTWEEPVVAEEPDPEESRGFTTEQLASWVMSHGRERVMRDYRLTRLPWWPEGADLDPAWFAERREAVINSPYFHSLPDAAQKEITEGLNSADIYEDPGGSTQDVFDRAEASLLLASRTLGDRFRG
jgi:hypothetical protein